MKIKLRNLKECYERNEKVMQKFKRLTDTSITRTTTNATRILLSEGCPAARRDHLILRAGGAGKVT